MPNDARTDLDLRESLLWKITGYQVSQAIYVAAKLGIADLLADGPMTSDQLASNTGAHAASLYRLLRALSSEGIFRESETETFELTPMGELLRTKIPKSMRSWAVMYNEEQYQAWGGMLGSVQDGDVAFDRVFDDSFFPTWPIIQRPTRHSIRRCPAHRKMSFPRSSMRMILRRLAPSSMSMSMSMSMSVAAMAAC